MRGRATRSQTVLIWSAEHHAFWQPNGMGYTTQVGRAGHYTRKDAIARTRHCGPEKGIQLVGWL